jgi:hypothetical protein
MSYFVIGVPVNVKLKIILNIRLKEPNGAKIIGEMKLNAITDPNAWEIIYKRNPIYLDKV